MALRVACIISSILVYNCFKDSIVIEEKSYKKIETLGKGAHGKVYLVTDELENKYALKIYHKSYSSKLQTGYEQVKKINSKHFAKIYNVSKVGELLIVLMEYVSFVKPIQLKSDLKYFAKIENEKEKRFFIYALIKLGQEMFKQKLIHTDIKPNNLLCGVDESNELLCKLIDYDTVKVYDKYDEVSKSLQRYIRSQISAKRSLILDQPESYNKSSLSAIIYFGFYFESIKIGIMKKNNIELNSTYFHYPQLEDSEEFKTYIKRGIVRTLIDFYKYKIDHDVDKENDEHKDHDKLSIEKIISIMSTIS